MGGLEPSGARSAGLDRPGVAHARLAMQWIIDVSWRERDSRRLFHSGDAAASTDRYFRLPLPRCGVLRRSVCSADIGGRTRSDDEH